MTWVHVLIDGHEVARHDGPLLDDDGRATPGTAAWWFKYALPSTLPAARCADPAMNARPQGLPALMRGSTQDAPTPP
jgi:hypothetical protein